MGKEKSKISKEFSFNEEQKAENIPAWFKRFVDSMHGVHCTNLKMREIFATERKMKEKTK